MTILNAEVRVPGYRSRARHIHTPRFYHYRGNCEWMPVLPFKSSRKKQENYSTTISWITAKVSFAILRSSLLCVRASRTKRRRREKDLEIDKEPAGLNWTLLIIDFSLFYQFLLILIALLSHTDFWPLFIVSWWLLLSWLLKIIIIIIINIIII